MNRGLNKIMLGTLTTVFAAVWALPFIYSVWTAFHDERYAANFKWNAPWIFDNFVEAWHAAPFAMYFANTLILITIVLVANLILCTLVAYAFVRYKFRWAGFLFALIMVQLLISPEILIVENYGTLARFELIDTILGIGLPYMASAFGIFLLRQTFIFPLSVVCFQKSPFDHIKQVEFDAVNSQICKCMRGVQHIASAFMG